MTRKNNFYLDIINRLRSTTKLERIAKDLAISKQNLNYYLRKLQKEGYLFKKGNGWYELTEKSKNMTNHDNHLTKDTIRGHAYVWKLQLEKNPKNWNKRIDILKKKNINYKLIGAKETTPRIKVLGRKVWLCNDNIRVYDTPEKSYYGKNAIESRYLALQEIKLILNAINRKLGINITPINISFQKEHYALIKNDLAIHENKRGNIIRVSDEQGEWLIIDDSLGEGGELENIGKKAFETNIHMKEWWNEHNKTNFQVRPSFIINSLNNVTQNQLMFDKNFQSHLEVINKLSLAVDELRDEIKKLNKV